MTFRQPHLSLALLLALTLAPAARGQDKPQRPPLDDAAIADALGADWYGVYLKGTKIGYSLTERQRGDTIVETSLMSVKLVSLGQKTELTSRQRLEFALKPPHRLLRATREESDGQVKQTTEMTADGEGDGYTATITTNGAKRTKTIAKLDFTLADSLAADVWVRGPRKPGEKIVAREIDLEELKTYLSTHTLIASKTVLTGGVEVFFHEVESVSEKLPVKSLSRLDRKGRMLSSTFAEVFEMRKESEKDAKNTEYSADVFVLGMVKIDKDLGDPRKVSELVLEVTGKEAAVLKPAPRQGVVAGEKGAAVVKLGKAHGPESKATAKELEGALAETGAYPIKLPKVRELAEKAIGDAKEPREKVRRLVKFVHDYVQPSLATSLPRLEDLLERKQGDCKSYALLFVALARAAGLPAREVGGLMYLGDDVKAFGGHAWNEVVLDGVWVPVDCSLNETELNATHIRFGVERDGLANILSALGRLSFRLVNVQHTK
jgi:protein-glutamine gamma-glutamyltransferase